MSSQPYRHDKKAQVKGIASERVERLLDNGLVERKKKTAEDRYGKPPSPLLSFWTGEDFGPEENESGSHSGEKEQKDDPE